MNLLVLQDSEIGPDGVVHIGGRRARHAFQVLKAAPGKRLDVGALGGMLGIGEVLECTPESLALRVVLDDPPPPPHGVDLLLAMPRPKALKRLLEQIASLGVRRLVLFNAARVEKSYFDTPALEPASIREHLLLGLEQGRETYLPEALIRTRFRPFVEDELDKLFPDAERLVADPSGSTTLAGLRPAGGCPAVEHPAGWRPAAMRPAVVAIGPEGGFVPFELDLLTSRGFRVFSLGPRILRVETAVPFILGQLLLTRSLNEAQGESA